MSRGRIKLNVAGGTKLGGAGATKALKLRKVKNKRVKVARTEAELDTPSAEAESAVYGKQPTVALKPAPRTADKGADVEKTATARVKALKPGIGWR